MSDGIGLAEALLGPDGFRVLRSERGRRRGGGDDSRATSCRSSCDPVGMPIANCLFASEVDPHPERIVTAWSHHSGIDPVEMTVNVVQVHQGGKEYAVIASLYLPSLWSGEEAVRLSEGLAAALADVAQVEPSSVQVLTSILTSGSVVEDGTTLRW